MDHAAIASPVVQQDTGPGEESVPVFDAKVVPLFPPRPDAIMTLLHSPDFLPGTQTLLYSLKKTLQTRSDYPPEIVVLVTPNIPSTVYEGLCPALCTRILPIREWHPPASGLDSKVGKKAAWQRTLDCHSPGWTKLQIFGLAQYETILFIDSDCLVLKDVSSLLDLNKVYTESEALIAAAPDMLPPHYFNSGVMVVRPSAKAITSLKRHAKLLTTFDGSDTGFLNAYFNTWNTEFPPMARLASGYNAQESMFDMTRNEQGESSFWDIQIAPDLHILHYSNAVKPWETEAEENALKTLWRTWHNKSKNFLMRAAKEVQRRKDQEEQKASKLPAIPKVPVARPPAPPPASIPRDPRQVHKLIAKRFKQLKGQGMSSKEAMAQARAEFGQKDEEEIDVGAQVAAMFGMRW